MDDITACKWQLHSVFGGLRPHIDVNDMDALLQHDCCNGKGLYVLLMHDVDGVSRTGTLRSEFVQVISSFLQASSTANFRLCSIMLLTKAHFGRDIGRNDLYPNFDL